MEWGHNMSYAGDERRKHVVSPEMCDLVHRQTNDQLANIKEAIEKIEEHIVGNGHEGILTRLAKIEDWILGSRGWRSIIVALVISVGSSVSAGLYIAGTLANQIEVNRETIDLNYTRLQHMIDKK